MDADSLLRRVANGRTDLIAEVIGSAASGPWPVVEGGSMLQWAAYYGDVSALRMLLERGASMADLGPNMGLNAAAFHGHWQLCEFLIENGATPGHADPATGETPLHSAITSDDRARYDLVVKVLLRSGADPNARTVPGVPTGSFMRDGRTRGEGPLHRAAAFGTADTVQLLFDAGALRDQVDDRGDSPLGWASWYRRPVEVLRLLLYAEHSIHPAYRPLRESLMGSPSGGRGA